MKPVFLMLGTMTLFTACGVHQWPEPNNEATQTPPTPTPPEGEKMARVKLNLKYFTDFTYQDHLYDVKSGAVTKVGEDGDTYDNLMYLEPRTPMKVTVKVHRDNSSQTLVLSDSFIKELDPDFDSELEIELPVGKDYYVTVWGHLLDENGSSFYDESDFNSIALLKEKYIGSTDMRDAFRGRVRLSIPDEEDVEKDVDMRRPMCKLEFVTTDLQEFLANEEKRLSMGSRAVSTSDYTVVISYPGWYPSNYMASEDRIEYADTGYKFNTKIKMESDSDTETSLGFDYVMIGNSSDVAVQAQVTVFHSDGTQVSSTGMITIPMQRDRHVVLRSTFLTTSGSGGVGIDPDFEGDINFPIY